jgi:hypothetical protein|tara:strand:- start:3937 stop:4287 length:351 start_codon:yes stop_codon:yes gene_type:complete
MDTPDRVLSIGEIKRRLKEEAHLIIPKDAHEYLLFVTAEASDLRDAAGELEAKFAMYKADLIREGNNGIAAKALAEGSEVGMQWAVVMQSIRGLDGIAQALKKSLHHLENNAKGIY